MCFTATATAKMQSVKYLIVAVLAVCALECQAAQVPYSADKLDLRLLVENGAVIAKNLFKAVNTGLDQSKPNVDKILNELAPEAKNYIRKIIDEARATINEEDKRVTQIFATLTKALDNLKPIKTCTDKVTGPAKKVALAAEKDIVKVITDIETKHKKEIDNLKTGTKKVVQKARTLFDTEVDAAVKCFAPGRKDAYDCINKELDKITKGVTEIAVDAFILIQTASETYEPILSEALEKLLPLLDKYSTQSKAVLKTLADCVATLKA